MSESLDLAFMARYILEARENKRVHIQFIVLGIMMEFRHLP